MMILNVLLRMLATASRNEEIFDQRKIEQINLNHQDKIFLFCLVVFKP
ncbi:hypothetical protein [Campylobacter concisus]|nr:hypothetical protein [Campylobacter concisus]